MKIKTLFAIVGILVCFSMANCKGQEPNGVIADVTPLEMQSLLASPNVQLVDVRTPKEFEEGHIANAVNIDYLSTTFDDGIKKLDKDKPIVVYCKSGRRSSESSKKLLNAGFDKIYNLEGGILAWQQEGLKVEK